MSKSLRIEKRKIDDLIPAIYNPRKDLQPDDPEYIKIKRSIQEFGYVDPIIVNERTGVVVGGHQRLKVLKELGYEEIEVSVVNLSEQKEKALNIALNKISGDWHYGLLKDLLLELDNGDFDVEITGFDMDEIEDLMTQFAVIETDDGEVKDDEFDVDENTPEVPMTKRGDIWLLGRHRLMCGDSTNSDDVAKLMDGKKADLIVTDPPYNVDYTGKTKDALKISNDNMDDDAFFKFLLDAFNVLYDIAKDGASIYVFHADTEGLNFRRAFIESGFKLAQCCIWAKQTMVMGRQDYHWQHEPILYGWKPTAGHNWYSDRKQTTLWHFDRPFRSEYHPTMKPVPLVSYPIKNSSKEEDLVVDLFGGSGSTLIACEQINRINYSMELDEKYCDVIIKRFINFVESDEDVYVIRDGVKISFADVPKSE